MKWLHDEREVIYLEPKRAGGWCKSGAKEDYSAPECRMMNFGGTARYSGRKMAWRQAKRVATRENFSSLMGWEVYFRISGRMKILLISGT